jgi:pSer/pThr/pTyr-binding forkhead associated (FHA) protein
MQRNPTITPGMQPASEEDTSAVRSNAIPGAANNRKLTGVLVTFSWRPQGQLFPLYEGRNVIGRGTIEAEGNRPVDVQVANDEMLSNDHATIRCRPGTSLFELVDNLSTNGTFYKGAEIERAAIKLEDGARFRTGATEWLMKKIEWTPEPVAPAAPAKSTAGKAAKGRGSQNNPE